MDYAKDFSGRYCVVTGGLGFIGSNVVHALVNAGAKVSIVDALVPRHGGSRANVPSDNVEVVVADIGDQSAVSPVVADAEFIFNLAGQVSHVDSMEDPLVDLTLNAQSHLAFLELLRHVNPEVPLVHTSTRQVYGRPKSLPVPESHPVQPIDVNGISKYAGEQFHLLYARVRGLRACALRLSNVYGPRQRLLGDQIGFLPTFIRRVLEDQPITLFGDGSQERDCLFVDDAVAAILQAVISPEAIGKVINIGHPEPLPLAKIADLIVEAAHGGDVEFIPWPRERERIDIGSYAAELTLAKQVLHWEPRTAFAEGIARTLDFYKANLEAYL